MYLALLAVLPLIFLFRRDRDATAAIAFFALCYPLSKIIFSLMGHYSPAQYYLVLGSSSFLLILLYHSRDITLPLLLAALCELTILSMCFLGALELKTGNRWVFGHFVTVVSAINIMELAILLGSWGIGDRLNSRPLYPRVWNPAGVIGTIGHQFMDSGQEKG